MNKPNSFILINLNESQWDTGVEVPNSNPRCDGGYVSLIRSNESLTGASRVPG